MHFFGRTVREEQGGTPNHYVADTVELELDDGQSHKFQWVVVVVGILNTLNLFYYFFSL